MDFRLLGPLEVVRGRERVTLSGDKPRALLVLLLLHRREVVSADTLIDELWGENPPPGATKTLHVYVSRLRKVLGEGLLETHGHGYRLAVASEAVDVDRFEAIVADARRRGTDGDARRARELLDEALALWRGDALADVRFEPFASAEIARLEELRLVAREELAESRLALGEHRELVPELKAAARAHPTRERLLGRLMLALYRSGAQAEALETYRRARAALVDELGVEPGPELRALEQRILEQDPSLDAPRRAAHRVPPVVAAHRGRLLVAAGCLVLAVTAIGLLVALGGEDEPSERVILRSGAIGSVAPRTAEVRDALSLGGVPVRMAADGRTLWVGNDRARAVAGIDPTRSSVVRTVAADALPSDLAAHDGTLWILDREQRVLLQVRRGYDRVVRRFRLPGAPREAFLRDRVPPEPWSVAADAAGAWVSDGSRRLFRVEAADGVRRVDAGHPIGGVAVDGDAVWAISHRPPSVIRVSARSGKVTARVPISGRQGFTSPYPIAVEVGAGSVWVLNANTGTVSRIDPDLRAVTSTTPVGIDHLPVRLAVGAGAVWVAAADGTLTRIDLRTDDVSTTAVANSLGDVAVTGDRVWVTTGRAGAGSRPAPEREEVAAGDVQPLPPSLCSPVYAAPGARPAAIVASDMPLQGNFSTEAIQITAAVRLIMRERGFRAGPHELGFQSCDHSAAGAGFRVTTRCYTVAKAYAGNTDVVGVVGPFASPCAELQLAALNAARPGPLASISPSTTYLGLTRGGLGTAQDEPERYQPSGRPSFARVVPADDVQGVALAELARELGLRRVLVLESPEPYSLLLASAFRATAERTGQPVAGTLRYTLIPSKRNERLPSLVRRERPDGVFLSGYLVPETASLLRRLRRAVGPDARVLLSDGFVSEFLADEVGPAAEGLLLSQPGPDLNALPPRGRRFVERFRREVGTAPTAYTVYAAQATEVMLDAIARSDASRPSVAHELFRAHITDGLLPDFKIAPTGDTTLTSVTIHEIRDGRLRVLRQTTPPPSLVEEVRRR